VKILAGTSSRTFTVRSTPVETAESGSVSATLGGITLTQDLTVTPMGLYSMTLSPTSVAGGNPVAGTVKLVCNAGPGPVTVELGSSDAAVAFPVAGSVVVPQGIRSASFELATTQVVAKTPVTITSVANGTLRSKTLTVYPMASASPTSLRFGSLVVGTRSPELAVTLSNKGVLPFEVTAITIGGTGAQHFVQVNDCPASLGPGETCSIGVTFTPVTKGGKSARLYLATSATATPLAVSLYGTGLTPP
jgi:hypothetical protein